MKIGRSPVALPGAVPALLAAIAFSCTDARAEPGANPNSCLHFLPKDIYTLAYAVYTGGLRSPAQLDNGNLARTKMVEVKVEKKDKPILLLLTSYEPVVWKLDVEPGANLLNIIVMGYSAQGVLDPPENVMVGFATRKDGRGTNCPERVLFSAYNNEDDFRAVMRGQIDRNVDEFHGTYSGKCMPDECKKASQASLWSMIFGTGGAEGGKSARQVIHTSSGKQLVVGQ